MSGKEHLLRRSNHETIPTPNSGHGGGCHCQECLEESTKLQDTALQELTRSDKMEYVSLLVVSFEWPSTTKVQGAATFQRNPVQACTMQRLECRRHLTFDSRQRIEIKVHERHAMRTTHSRTKNLAVQNRASGPEDLAALVPGENGKPAAKRPPHVSKKGRIHIQWLEQILTNSLIP